MIEELRIPYPHHPPNILTIFFPESSAGRHREQASIPSCTAGVVLSHGGRGPERDEDVPSQVHDGHNLGAAPVHPRSLQQGAQHRVRTSQTSQVRLTMRTQRQLPETAQDK